MAGYTAARKLEASLSQLVARLRNALTPAWPIIIAVQATFLLLFAVDWKLPMAGTVGFLVMMVLLDRPVWAVCIMIAARLSSTATTSFFSIGKVNIGLFEPVLLLSLLGLGLKAVFTQKALWRQWPWQYPFIAIAIWKFCGLFWSVNKSDGIKDILSLIIIFCTATVIQAFIETWDDVKTAIWFWLATCVGIGVLAIFGDAIGLTDYSSMWKAAESGGRSTGLGQQPNWFAMNQMFIVLSVAAFALIQKDLLIKWGLLAATVFVFFSTMTSGSRGGAYSIVIGAGIVALGQPLFRKWVIRFAVVGGALFAVAYFGDIGDIGKGLNRITNSLTTTLAKDIRGMNWAACVAMFTDSYGLGIGTGGYVDLLPKYNWFIYESVYRYPHGIFWGEMAHGGVIGVILYFTVVAVIGWMAVKTVQYSKGTEAESLAWSMAASMAGYFAWSFVEFNIDEKPFWEWLGLYTALYHVARRHHEGKGPPIPKWELTIR